MLNRTLQFLEISKLNEKPSPKDFFKCVKSIQNSKENYKSISVLTVPVSLCIFHYFCKFLADWVAWGPLSAGYCMLILLIAMNTECIHGRFWSFNTEEHRT